jgi:cobalt-zinc-cadmium efflux system membrane fusion protein
MMNRSRTGSAGYLSLLAVTILLGAMCGCKTAESAPGTTASDAGAAGGSGDNAQLFKLAPEQIAHLQIVSVAPTTISRTLRLTGAVAFNGFATTPVISQIGGPVSRIVVMPGEQVRKNQPLLYVASPDYSQLLANYLKARDAYQLADKEYQRSQDLYEHRAIAERDLAAAESVRTQAAADLGAAEQGLKVLGISKPEAMAGKPMPSAVAVRAPIDGEAVERLVSPGQVIQGGATQVFTISDLSTVWVLANIYQKDLPYVHQGDPVTISTDLDPGADLHGKISYISAALDPNTRTLQARIEVKNPQHRLKRDMYVTATVHAGSISNALAVPNAAVLRDSENQPFVYVVNQNNEFARRAVTLGESGEGVTQLVSGVAAGERVVGDGSLFLQFATSVQQ